MSNDKPKKRLRYLHASVLNEKMILFPNIVCTLSTNISYAVKRDSAKGEN